jgi:hypothetical protein
LKHQIRRILRGASWNIFRGVGNLSAGWAESSLRTTVPKDGDASARSKVIRPASHGRLRQDLACRRIRTPVNELGEAVDGSDNAFGCVRLYRGAAGGRDRRDSSRHLTRLIEAEMTMMRRTVILSASFSLGGLFLLITAEFCLRFLPVATGLLVQTVNADNPVLRFTPKTEFTYSTGWSLADASKGGSTMTGG